MEEKHFDKKGREIIKRIDTEKYSIKFVKQDNLKNDLSSLYKSIAELLYEEAVN